MIRKHSVRSGVDELLPSAPLAVYRGRHPSLFETRPLWILVAVDEAHELGSVGGVLRAHHETDRLALSHTQTIAVADELHVLMTSGG